jgi:hypothetical protein
MSAWGNLTWNVGNWGEGGNSDIILTGFALTGATGSVSTTSTVELGWGRDLWGARSWGNPSQIVTPVVPEDDMTLTLASVSVTAEINAGWGRLTWGENAWGEYGDAVITGQAMSMALSSVTVQADAIATNSTNNNQELGVVVQDIISGGGAVEGTTVAYITDTDLVMTNTLGTADAGPDAMATGIEMTANLGSVSAYNETGWGRQHWGDNAWGVEGTWVTAAPSGIGMTAALNSVQEINGDASLTLNTLNEMQLTNGGVDVAPDAMITGNFMIGALGTLGQGSSKTVTGFGLTNTLGSATLDANSIPTISALTEQRVRLSSDSVIKIHADVDITGFGLTAALGTGSALIWNEVPTGSAPITPPGWTEVAA